jgi:fructose-1,6-bisphosphatase/inositol monophosphatase family enzyme
MDGLSLDYSAVIAAVVRPVTPELVGVMLVIALGDRYEAEHGQSALHEFTQSEATYL